MNKHKYLLMILGILVISAGLYTLLHFSIIQPMIAENEQLEQEISMYSATMKQLAKEEINDKPVDEFSKLLVSIPSNKEPDKVLASINTLASKASVTVTHFASIEGDQDSKEPLNEAIYTLEVNGSNLRQINNFLNSIRESERLMTVETLEINHQGTSTTAIMNITTYYLNH